MNNLELAYAAIAGERAYQKDMESSMNAVPNRDKDMGDFVVFLRQYMNQTISAYSTIWDGGDAARNMVRKVVALVFAYFEDYEVVNFTPTYSPPGESRSQGSWINKMNQRLQYTERAQADTAFGMARAELEIVASLGLALLRDYGAPQRPGYEYE